jgi:hypothetical protein
MRSYIEIRYQELSYILITLIELLKIFIVTKKSPGKKFPGI